VTELSRDEMTRENATHVLLCHKGIGRAHWAYTMPCHVLKEMPDGVRSKILVFGFQNSGSGLHESRVRYVNTSRLGKRRGRPNAE